MMNALYYAPPTPAFFSGESAVRILLQSGAVILVIPVVQVFNPVEAPDPDSSLTKMQNTCNKNWYDTIIKSFSKNIQPSNQNMLASPDF